ncbi:MAG: hypothetical protein A2521_16110 [Deltaproteobacteria bacterium RIFOXYD12_FULL_57_12]|nr:MAG: hypothetical protein A2521_16110 [Deltaproteobacteria bacterium RIFOXYD12_FULL_57_12]
MNIEGIFPLVMLWVVWRIFSKVQEKLKGLPTVQPQPRASSATGSIASADLESLSYDELGGAEVSRLEITPAISARTKSAAPRVASPAARTCHKYSHRTLRRAVVWSEILAPPIGLRDEENHYR